MRFDTYSLSRIRKFEDCAFAGYGHYIKKIRDERTPVYFTAGRSIEDAITAAMLDPDRSEDDLLAIMEDVWREEYEELTDEEEEKKKRCGDAIPVIKEELVPKILEKWTGDREDIQKQFYIPCGEYEFTGIIDIVGKEGYLIDIKTAGKSWPNGKEEQEEQAFTYPLWSFSQDTELKECTFAFYIVVLNKTPKIDIREVKVSREDVISYLKLIESRATLIDSMLDRYANEFDPKVFPANRQSWNCSKKKCPVWELCEETWGWRIKE